MRYEARFDREHGYWYVERANPNGTLSAALVGLHSEETARQIAGLLTAEPQTLYVLPSTCLE